MESELCVEEEFVFCIIIVPIPSAHITSGHSSLIGIRLWFQLERRTPIIRGYE